MKTKLMNKTAVLRNINGLSLGDRAYCGPYGIVTCTKAAAEKRGARRFKVANSTRLRNGGGWTMANLRKAIEA